MSSDNAVLTRVSRMATKIIDGCLERPGMYASEKGELVAVVWTAMNLEAEAYGCIEIVRNSQGKTFLGAQRISTRYPGIGIVEFAENLRPWVEEYRRMLGERK